MGGVGRRFLKVSRLVLLGCLFRLGWGLMLGGVVVVVVAGVVVAGVVVMGFLMLGRPRVWRVLWRVRLMARSVRLMP